MGPECWFGFRMLMSEIYLVDPTQPTGFATASMCRWTARPELNGPPGPAGAQIGAVVSMRRSNMGLAGQ